MSKLNPATVVRSYLGYPHNAKGTRAETLDCMLSLAAVAFEATPGIDFPADTTAAEAVTAFVGTFAQPKALEAFRAELQRATAKHAERGE